MPNHRQRIVAWSKIALKLLLVTLVVWGTQQTVRGALEQLHNQHWSWRSLNPLWVVVAMGLYLLGMVPAAWFWRQLLLQLGQRPSRRATWRAYVIGHLGKYVPGKALVVILRTALIRDRQTTATVAAVTVFYETLTMMAVGAMLAGAILLFYYRQSGYLVSVAGLMMLVAGVPTLPPVFRWIARLLRVGKADPGALEQLAHLRYRTLATGWVSLLIGWIFWGASLWFLLLASGYTSWATAFDDLVRCIASTALAVVAGFLSLIPGGAMVREAVFLELLKPRFGEGGALVAAVVARLAWLAAELIAAAVMYVGYRRTLADRAPLGTGETAS